MSRLTIYVEGGGTSAGQRKRLREGMDVFLADLKDMARKRRRGLRLVPCGGRRMAYEAFANARDHAEDGETVVLLVDSEAPVTAAAPAAHLRERQGDQWELAGVPDDHIHLMVQVMETWIVADPDALAGYCGQGFRANALPNRQDLQEKGKEAVASALERATRHTQKGSYHKLRHGSELLKLIDAAKVRQRCRHCERLFVFVAGAVEQG